MRCMAMAWLSVRLCAIDDGRFLKFVRLAIVCCRCYIACTSNSTGPRTMHRQRCARPFWVSPMNDSPIFNYGFTATVTVLDAGDNVAVARIHNTEVIVYKHTTNALTIQHLFWPQRIPIFITCTLAGLHFDRCHAVRPADFTSAAILFPSFFSFYDFFLWNLLTKSTRSDLRVFGF